MFVLREDDPIKQLKITFNRIADPLLLYAVEAANHLAESWFTIWTSTGATNTAGSVTVGDIDVCASPKLLRFLRLRVSSP